MHTKNIALNSSQVLSQLNSLSVSELEELIQRHNHLYFTKNDPEISDEAFDKLVQALQLAMPFSPVLAQVGSPQVQNDTFGETVTHQQKMLSLDKCYDDEHFSKWREKIKGDVIAMPKIDGVACSIRYDSTGNLSLAATRGDGSAGENITANVLRIADVPKAVNKKLIDGFEVRGEVYMKLSRFNKHYSQQFANPRNLAAGALKQKSSDRSAEYGLSFFPYDIRGTDCATEKEKFALLAQLGFTPPDVQELGTKNVTTIYQHYVNARATLDYEIDGVVFRANEVSEQEALGNTAHHPRYAIAYKFQGESAQTQVKAVEWSVGRSGIITPVCIVDPVFVSGATVTRASLHNLGIFKSHGLCEHTLVELVRRGGVIPYVERVLRAEGKPYEIPSHCPSCHKEVQEDGDFLFCTHPESCPKVILARLIHFVSVIDLQGFGEKIVEQLISQGLVQRLADIYRLTQSDLLSLERMGEKSSSKLIKEIESKRSLELATFLCALGFDEVGPTVAQAIAEHFVTLDQVLAASEDQLAAIDGIGPSISQSLVRGMRHFRQDIESLREQVQVKACIKNEVNASHPLFEKSIVFTGALQMDRKEAQKRAKAAGAKTPSAVSAQTDYLVNGGEEAKVSSKLALARKLNQAGANIQIISEEQFLELLKS